MYSRSKVLQKRRKTREDLLVRLSLLQRESIAILTAVPKIGLPFDDVPYLCTYPSKNLNVIFNVYHILSIEKGWVRRGKNWGIWLKRMKFELKKIKQSLKLLKKG